MRRHRMRTMLIATLAVLTLLAVIDLGFADGAMFVGFLDPLVHPKQVQGPPELGPDLPRASRADSLSCDGLPVKELFLDNPLGSIDIVGTDGDEIRVNYDVTVYAKSQAVARAYLAEVQVEPVPVGDNGLRFSVTEAPLRPETVYYIQVDYRIEAPERLALSIDNGDGDVTVSGFSPHTRARHDLWVTDWGWARSVPGAVDIENHGGSLHMADLEGSWSVYLSDGHLTAENIKGNLAIALHNGTTSITGSEGFLALEAWGSAGHVSDVAGSVACNLWGRYYRSSPTSGEFHFDNITGDLSINSHHTQIDISGISGFTAVEAAVGDITIRQPLGPVEVVIREADIFAFLDESAANHRISAISEHGRLRIENLPLQVDDQGRLLGVILGDGENLMRLEATGGDINLIGVISTER